MPTVEGHPAPFHWTRENVKENSLGWWRRVRWRWGQQFGVVHSLSVLGIIWIGDSQYCAPLRRWKIKSPAHSATAQESGINRVTHSWVKKSGEKIDYTFMGTGLFNLLFSQWNPASQGLYLRVRETEGGTRKKKILASKTIMGSPMRLSLLWVFFTAPKTRANNRGSKLTFASFLHINSRLILLHMWFLTVRNNALLLEFAEGPTAHRKPWECFNSH